MRVILTKEQAEAQAALAALQKDDSDETWQKVAKKYSIDEATKSTGGLRQGVVQGQSEPALDDQIFSAQPNTLVGPFKGDAGYYVIEVEKITPAVTTPLDDVRQQISQTLVGPAPAADRPGLPGRLPDQVDRAHVLRRRLPDRPLLERRAAAADLHRGADRDHGLRRAGAAARRLRARAPRASSARRRRPSAPGPGPPGLGRRQPGQLPPGLVPGGSRAPGQRPARAACRPAPCRRGQRAAPAPPRRPRRRPAASPPMDDAEALERLDQITRRLRRECPWDREQDERSIVPHTVEEAYELADAAARATTRSCATSSATSSSRSSSSRCCSRSATRARWARSPTRSTEKLIRRHPHVFGEAEAETSREVLRNWDQIKREVEGRGADDPFADVPENLPGLLYARKTLRRAEPEGGGQADRESRDAAELAVGEMLLEAVRLSRRLGVDPELALRAAADRLQDAVPLASRAANGLDRAHPRAPDPRLAGQPDGRGRRAPRARAPAGAPRCPRAPRPASSRRPSFATAATPGPARASARRSTTSTTRSPRR